MTTKGNMIQDYDAVLDARYGKEGTPERIRFEEEAYAYYSGLILRDARKEAKVTQAELARRTQTTKSYISRIENGLIIPSVAVFYRLIAALGMSVEIVKPIAYGYNSCHRSTYLCEPEQESYKKSDSEI
ncbi:MAG: helix-turn-helix transcriptional regulator [Bacteroidales bacterium]|nr:helix-turn-helix transcriptional regulator [Bacteroidales bacterium]